jgi:uncharacterized protein (TIGR02145 family)
MSKLVAEKKFKIMKIQNFRILNKLLLLILVASLTDCKKDEPQIPTTVTDIDGNNYNVIVIGTQVWMKENLKTTRYNNGNAITNVIDNAAWIALTTHGYCWYNNNASTYKANYGALYNWYAVTTGKLCPSGWHVPTDAEWTTLTTYLDGESVAGGKLKEIDTPHWTMPNTSATNETGFTALPGGNRSNPGTFFSIGLFGVWWTSTEYSAATAYYRNMAYNNSSVGRVSTTKSDGFSVRCVKD